MWQSRRFVVDHRSAIRQFVQSKETTPELTQNILGRLLDRERASAQRSNRHLILVFLSALAFELLNRNLVGEFSLGGIKLAGLSFIRTLIPVFMGYAYAVAFFSWLSIVVQRRVLHQYMEVAFPGLYQSRLWDFLESSTSPLTEDIPESFVDRGTSRALDVAMGIQVLLFIIGPIVFIAYAYVQLFKQQGAGALPLWICLGVNLVLFAAGAILLMKSITLEE